MSNGPDWYEKAQDQIESDLAEGLIDSKEYNAQIRDLNSELRQGAEEAAYGAYSNYIEGTW